MTQMNAQTAPTPLLLKTQCDSCLSSGPLLEQLQRGGNHDTLCPSCAARDALSDTAADNLHALLWPILVQWAQFWQAAGVSTDHLEGTLYLYGEYWHPHGAQGRPSGTEGRAVQDALSGKP